MAIFRNFLCLLFVHFVLSIDLDIPKVEVPNINLPVEPEQHSEGYQKLNAGHHSIGGKAKAGIEKKSGSAEKSSNYEKDRGFYFVKAYGWDREKKNEHAAGHGVSLKAGKSAKFHKQAAHLNAKAGHSDKVEHVPVLDKSYNAHLHVPEIPQVEYDQSSEHRKVHHGGISKRILTHDGNSILNNAKPKNMHYEASMLGPHVPGYDYRYRVQHLPRHAIRPTTSNSIELNGHYKNSYDNQNTNPHLHELIRITKRPDSQSTKSNMRNYDYGKQQPNWSPPRRPSFNTNHEELSSYRGPAEVYYEEEDDDDDSTEEGRHYYDQPISSFELQKMRQGHSKYSSLPDDQLVQHFYPNRNRFERLNEYRPSPHRYRLYEGSHYY